MYNDISLGVHHFELGVHWLVVNGQLVGNLHSQNTTATFADITFASNEVVNNKSRALKCRKCSESV